MNSISRCHMRLESGGSMIDFILERKPSRYHEQRSITSPAYCQHATALHHLSAHPQLPANPVFPHNCSRNSDRARGTSILRHSSCLCIRHRRSIDHNRSNSENVPRHQSCTTTTILLNSLCARRSKDGSRRTFSCAIEKHCSWTGEGT